MATPRQPAHLAAHAESRHAEPPPPGSLTSTPARRPAAPPRRAPHDRWLSARRRPSCPARWHRAGAPGPRAPPSLSPPSAPYPRLRAPRHPARVGPPL